MKAAALWFDNCENLSERASLFEKALGDAIERHEDDAVIERKRLAAESEKRQEEVFIKKHDELIAWLNSHK